MLYDVEGIRSRDFKDGVLACSESAFPDWLVRGPRTSGFCLRFLSQAGSPLLWDTKWGSETKLPADHKDRIQHAFLAKLVQVGIVYDQLDELNLVTFELIFREMQVIEERHADRVLTNLDGEDEYRLLMSINQTQIMVSPALKEFLATELGKEASVLKERRKAREERVLARTPKKPKGLGKGEGGT